MKGRWESNINVWFVEDRMLITRRVRADWQQGIMHAFYRNMLADLPVDDCRISARVARTFSPATVPIYSYVFPEMELCSLIFQNRILMFCLPIPTLIYLWEIYIFPGSACLFCCSLYVDHSWEYINRSQIHECRHWDWGRAIPFPGIHKLYFRYSVVSRHGPNFVLEYDKDYRDQNNAAQNSGLHELSDYRVQIVE